MVKRIGLCCLVLALAGLTPPPRADRWSDPEAGRTADLLRLRAPNGDLSTARVAELFPDLVERDADGAPRAVRYPELTALLLEEVARLAGRVERLEAGLRAASAGARAEPLVRIKVEHRSARPES